MLTLSEQLRAAHVRRWHIVQVAREQTLAEHLFCVAVIAGALANRMKWYEALSHSTRLQLLNWALWHDMMEVRTGDMPTPFKKALEQVAGEGVVEKAEELIDHDAMGMHRQVRGTVVEAVVKMADLLEAIKFLSENAIGRHAFDVLAGIQRDFEVAVEKYDKLFPDNNIRAAAREVCSEMGVTWMHSL